MSWQDRRSYAPGCYPYRNAEERDRVIAQLTLEYAHLPQNVIKGDFFLLPPTSETAQEIGAKGARTAFHVTSEMTGKRIATANGFARMEALSPCQNLTGKGCSGKLPPSREGEAAKDSDCRQLTLLVQHIAKLLVAMSEVMPTSPCVSAMWEMHEAAKELGKLTCLK